MKRQFDDLGTIDYLRKPSPVIYSMIGLCILEFQNRVPLSHSTNKRKICVQGKRRLSIDVDVLYRSMKPMCALERLLQIRWYNETFRLPLYDDEDCRNASSSCLRHPFR
jgi:hypothetical protein